MYISTHMSFSTDKHDIDNDNDCDARDDSYENGNEGGEKVNVTLSAKRN